MFKRAKARAVAVDTSREGEDDGERTQTGQVEPSGRTQRAQKSKATAKAKVMRASFHVS